MKSFVTGLFEKIKNRLSGLSLPALEQKVYEREDSIRALPSAPQRFDIEKASFFGSKLVVFLKTIRWPFYALPLLSGMIKDIKTSFTSLDKNPSKPREYFTRDFLMEFEEYARSLGIGAIGYAKLPREAIFKGKAVLFDRVIVLTMEMPKEKIDMAPSIDTLKMVMETYYELGNKINFLVDYLRKNGYAAQAGHPLGGLSLYPLIAEKAGLGWHGSHGLLISPEFGCSQRIGVVYTNIKNLPMNEKNDHEWIEDFCAKCGKCIRMCPGKAIYEEPIIHESGIITHIDRHKCFSEFAGNYGCSVCIKECPFTKTSYSDIKKRFKKS